MATGVVTALLASYGEFTVAAYGIGTRLEFLANSVIFALAASIGPFVGQNLGKGRLDRVRESVKVSNRFALVWGFFAWLVLGVFSRPIASVFNNHEEVIQTVQLFLWIVPAGFGLQGVLSIINSQLNTVNKPVHASLIIVTQMLVLGIPIIYLGGNLGEVRGIFIGLAITYAVGGILSLAVNNRVIKEIEMG